MGYFNRDTNNRKGRDNRGGGRGFGGGRDSGRRNDGPREMFKTVCSSCGKDCEVPFRPTTGKPVYCSDCFEKVNPRNEDSYRNDRQERNRSNFGDALRREDRPQPSRVDNTKQFEELNKKLDRIISILEKTAAKTEEIVVEEVPMKDSEVKKTPKASKKKKEIKE